jgi:hypothetical protein
MEAGSEKACETAVRVHHKYNHLPQCARHYLDMGSLALAKPSSML